MFCAAAFVWRGEGVPWTVDYVGAYDVGTRKKIGLSGYKVDVAVISSSYHVFTVNVKYKGAPLVKR